MNLFSAQETGVRHDTAETFSQMHVVGPHESTVWATLPSPEGSRFGRRKTSATSMWHVSADSPSKYSDYLPNDEATRDQ